MEEFGFHSSSHCLVCNDFVSFGFKSCSSNEDFVNEKLFETIECLFDFELPKGVSVKTVVCENCLNKIQDYDLHMTRAGILKENLMNTFKTSKFHGIQVDHDLGNFLSEDFPEIEFDFGYAPLENFNHQKTLHPYNGISENCETEYCNKRLKIESPRKMIRLMTCDFCNLRGFKNRRSLTSHIKSHLKNRISCDNCKLRFRSTLSYEIHLATNHGRMKTNILCPFVSCQRIFESESGLRAHFTCHKKNEGNPRFVCETCGKGFDHKLSFSQHMKIHKGKRDKECEVCGFRAISSTHLRRHIRARHTKEKNHVCSFCEKAFSERYNMTAHIRTQHLESKTSAVKYSQNCFKCSFCGSEFFDDGKLNQHLEFFHNVVEVEIENGDAF